MSDLPAGWVRTKLDEIAADVTYGYTAKANPDRGDIKMLRITDIQNNRVDWSSVPYCSIRPAEKARYMLRPNDIVFARTGATVGKSFLLRKDIPEAVYASYLIRVRCAEPSMARFLSHFFKSQSYWNQITEFSAGIGQPNVNGSKLRDLIVPVAPLNEQNRIADKLDSLLAKVDACRECLNRIPEVIKRFRQAVLDAVVSGNLTSDWREEHGKGEPRWSVSNVGEIIKSIDAGINVKCVERPPESNERGLVKISAVTWGEYDDDESKTLPPNRKVPEDTRIQVGDFLISRANTIELVGACVIVRHTRRPVFLSDKVLRLSMRDEHKPWLMVFLRSSEGRAQIEKLASGNQLSMRNLSQANLRSIRVPMPPPAEIALAIKRSESLLRYALAIERHHMKSANQLSGISQGILAKAFCGELSPQDPTDEPANALLDRIRVARSLQQESHVHAGRGSVSDRSHKEEVIMMHRKEVPSAYLTGILKVRGPQTAESLWAASKLEIDDFYDVLRNEEAGGLLKETRSDDPNAPRLLEAA